jgi:hypothetical protein
MGLYELLGGRLLAGGHLMFDVVNAPTRNVIEARINTRSIDEILVYDMSYAANGLW